MQDGSKRRWTQWTEMEARAALREWERTGESAAEFARRKGFSPHRMAYWRAKLGSPKPPAFIPVVLPPSAPPAGARIEITHGELVVRVREDLDATALVRILDALARAGRAC